MKITVIAAHGLRAIQFGVENNDKFALRYGCAGGEPYGFRQ
ncbi:hypothetical protein [Erythrobacter donghaensis]|nr:hypothetical protein [Erythrobacter donghaensis]